MLSKLQLVGMRAFNDGPFPPPKKNPIYTLYDICVTLYI